MKEKMIKELTEYLCKNLSTEDQKIFEEMEIAKKFEEFINNGTKDLSEEESLHILDRLKLSIEQADLGYSFEDISHKDMDILSNVNNYMISMEEVKEIYSLEELLEKCSLKQLNLYYTFYNYIYSIYKFDKIHAKKKLIDILKKDISYSFKSYIGQVKKNEIKFYQNVLKNNGVAKDVEEDLIQMGFFIPFKLKKGKTRYVMAKELLEIIKQQNFKVTSETTKDFVSKLVQYFVASKGVVSEEEVEKFFINVSDINIKKEELFEIMDHNFSKKEDYYYSEKIITPTLFNKLVKIKKENPYIPEYEEIIFFEAMTMDLYTLLLGISQEEVKMGRILKDMFYQPCEVSTLVKKLSKKLKIRKKDEEQLEDFIYENIIHFPYWIYNGESDDFDDFGNSFFELEGLDSEDNLEITETDLPF